MLQSVHLAAFYEIASDRFMLFIIAETTARKKYYKNKNNNNKNNTYTQT